MQRRMAADSAPILDEEGEEDEDSTSFKDSKIKFASKKRQSLWRSHLCLLIFPMVAIASLVIVGVAVALGLGSGISSRQENLPIDPYLRAQALLSKYPVVDGLAKIYTNLFWPSSDYLVFHLLALVCRHNDLAWQIRVHFQNQLDLFDLRLNMSEEDPNTYGREWHTDIPRLQAGRVGVQVIKCNFDSTLCTAHFSSCPVINHQPLSLFPSSSGLLSWAVRPSTRMPLGRTLNRLISSSALSAILTTRLHSLLPPPLPT